ncbi:S-phase kinase-associated protein 1 [Vairimorpha necatrix]|uniref:S-phase kinase-associated protein 1 n=1 Tax=Vairimorpha necatrix TaxID=6039 RepID=A0AAX4JG18_9MICR
MVLLKTFDDVLFTFDNKYLSKSRLLFSIHEHTVLCEPVPLLITHDILEIVYNFMKIDVCILSSDYSPYDLRFKQSDLDFFSAYDCNKLIELSNASSYLEYYFCLEVCCKLIARKLENKSVKMLKKQIGDINIQDNQDFEWISSEEE